MDMATGWPSQQAQMSLDCFSALYIHLSTGATDSSPTVTITSTIYALPLAAAEDQALPTPTSRPLSTSYASATTMIFETLGAQATWVCHTL
jgi:hypothetical protein